MAGKIKFECLKCGECCRNLHVRVEVIGAGWVTLGLFVLPRERKLFPNDIIAPMYGCGWKGRSRPRPKVIYAYTITKTECPHLRADNLCEIYDKRLLSCRAFPREMNMLDRRCTWAKQHFEEGEITPRAELDLGDLQKYHDMLFEHISRFASKYLYMWVYDLSEHRWKATKW